MDVINCRHGTKILPPDSPTPSTHPATPTPALTHHTPCMRLVWVQHEASQLSGGSECGGQGCQ